jgi:lysozyme
MRTSADGRARLKVREGQKLKAYADPGTGGAPWTIGYGHTGADVYPGLVITESKAEQMLVSDLLPCEAAVKRLVTVTLTQAQFDALVSLTYNIGVDAFERSTLRRKLNMKDYNGAADEFLRWNRSGGRVMDGLTRRRREERAQFLGG